MEFNKSRIRQSEILPRIENTNQQKEHIKNLIIFAQDFEYDLSYVLYGAKNSTIDTLSKALGIRLLLHIASHICKLQNASNSIIIAHCISLEIRLLSYTAQHKKFDYCCTLHNAKNLTTVAQCTKLEIRLLAHTAQR